MEKEMLIQRYTELIELMEFVREFVNDMNYEIAELALEVLEVAGKELDDITYKLYK